MHRTDTNRARIGGRMRERRRALGMTQQQCAALLRLSRLSRTRIELGYRRLKCPNWRRSARCAPVLFLYLTGKTGGGASAGAIRCSAAAEPIGSPRR